MKQEISILINGKEKKYSAYNRKEITETNTELAATIENVSQGDYTLLTVPIKKNELAFKRKKFTVFSPKRTGFTFQKNGKSFSKQIAAAIMAAVITGTALGLIVLMVFSTDITEAGTNKTVTNEIQKQESPSSDKFEKLPTINLEFSALQAGVFSTKESAEEAVKTIEDKGFSTSILPVEDGKFSVLVGIGNKTHLLDQYEADYEKQMEKVLPKTITYSFEDLTTPNKLDESYFTNGNVLLQNVLTLSQLSETNESALDNTLVEFNKWKDYGKKQQVNWKEDTAKAASDFEKQLEGAFLALKESKKGDVNWAFQQKAMDSFQAYKKLLNTLK